MRNYALNNEVEVIRFFDDDTAQEALVIVRAAMQKVGLCISREHDGDIEVMIPISQCESVIKAMERALQRASESQHPPDGL